VRGEKGTLSPKRPTSRSRHYHHLLAEEKRREGVVFGFPNSASHFHFHLSRGFTQAFSPLVSLLRARVASTSSETCSLRSWRRRRRPCQEEAGGGFSKSAASQNRERVSTTRRKAGPQKKFFVHTGERARARCRHCLGGGHAGRRRGRRRRRWGRAMPKSARGGGSASLPPLSPGKSAYSTLLRMGQKRREGAREINSFAHVCPCLPSLVLVRALVAERREARRRGQRGERSAPRRAGERPFFRGRHMGEGGG